MDGYSVLCLLLAGGGVLFGVVQRLRARRLLERMDRMLGRALEGQFQETTFDEMPYPTAVSQKRFLPFVLQPNLETSFLQNQTLSVLLFHLNHLLAFHTVPIAL